MSGAKSKDDGLCVDYDDVTARGPTTVASLLKEADMLEAKAEKARERAKKAEIKEAIAESAKSVKDLEVYLRTLNREVEKITTTLEKARAKHIKLTDKHRVPRP
jgi:chromosome segregation ATPase